jgi:serine/threonine-protein phosphatase 5
MVKIVVHLHLLATNHFIFSILDRGSFSVEVILTLLAWKLALPESVHLSRGNHESIDMNKMCM